MTMQFRILNGSHLPNQWTDKELPHELDCGVSMSAAFASMSTLSAPMWVPANWIAQLDRSWEDLESAVHATLKSRLASWPAQLDHRDISSALPCDRVCYQVQRHNETVELLVYEMSGTQNDKAIVAIEPAAWLELQHKLRQYRLKPSDWSREVEQEKYDELLAFLRRGELPRCVSMGAKHIPALTDAQAAGVLWFLNVVIGLDTNDIRYGPCGMCGGMTTSEETRSCEGCEVRMCDDCFSTNSGGDDHDIDWWPENLNDDFNGYCDKCVKKIRQIVIGR